MEEKISTFILDFKESNCQENSFELMCSDLFFDVPSDEIEKVWNSYVEKYEQVKSILQKLGDSIVEDKTHQHLLNFELSEEEKYADLLSLYRIKDFRFGVLLRQEDKELPIELVVTGFNETIKSSNKPNQKTKAQKKAKVGSIEFLNETILLEEDHFKYSKISLDRNSFGFHFDFNTPIFCLSLDSNSTFFGGFRDDLLENAIKKALAKIKIRLYPSENHFDSQENFHAYLEETNHQEGEVIQGSAYDNWLEEKFRAKYPNKNFNYKRLIDFSLKIESKTERENLNRNETVYQLHLAFKMEVESENNGLEILKFDSKVPFVYEHPFSTKIEENKGKSVPIIESIIQLKAHKLDDKIEAIQEYLKAGNSIPITFSDGRFTIFHLVESINYISTELREEDKRYLDLVLNEISETPKDCLDTITGFSPLLLAYNKRLKGFIPYLESKGWKMQTKLPKDIGIELILKSLPISIHYRDTYSVNTILNFVPENHLKQQEQLLFSKLLKGGTYGSGKEIFKALIKKGLNPHVPLESGFSLYAYALVQGEEDLIDVYQTVLHENPIGSQTDFSGNNLLHLFFMHPLNNDFIRFGIDRLKGLLKLEGINIKQTNNNGSNALHLLALKEIDSYNSKENKKEEAKVLWECYQLLKEHFNLNDTDNFGHSFLHYIAGLGFLRNKNGVISSRKFTKTYEQPWRLKIVKDLLKQNIDLTLKNNVGLTAKDIAGICKLEKIEKNL
ncbi:MAG: hypothetical protein ACPGSD_04535 [Flavobacteriales bacterium]